MKLGSLFDGIGGALLCAKLSDIEPVWASEIEPFAIKVTQHHFPCALFVIKGIADYERSDKNV